MSEPKIFCLDQKENFIHKLKKINTKKHEWYKFRGNMASIQYTYDGKYERNILIVDQTGCGKTKTCSKFGQNQFIWWP